jgi:hypothetical protein
MVAVGGLLLLLGRRVPAALRHGGVAVRRDTAAAADVLATLDQTAHRVVLRMLLLGMPGGPGMASHKTSPVTTTTTMNTIPITDPDMRTSLPVGLPVLAKPPPTRRAPEYPPSRAGIWPSGADRSE